MLKMFLWYLILVTGVDDSPVGCVKPLISISPSNTSCGTTTNFSCTRISVKVRIRTGISTFHCDIPVGGSVNQIPWSYLPWICNFTIGGISKNVIPKGKSKFGTFFSI